MKVEIEVPDHKIVDQNEYADWYLSRADMERIGEAADGKCRIGEDISGAAPVNVLFKT